jgi:DNA-binding XRE family transcriptional regulator
MTENISKKFGGQERADKARKDMEKIFSDPAHSLYLEKDIDLAKKYNVSRLTIYNIREQLKIPPRTNRILGRLKSVNSKQYTKKELSELLGLKYQNLYKIIREYKIKFKEDTPPIISMIRHQKEKRAEKTIESKKTKKASEPNGLSKTNRLVKAK